MKYVSHIHFNHTVKQNVCIDESSMIVNNNLICSWMKSASQLINMNAIATCEYIEPFDDILIDDDDDDDSEDGAHVGAVLDVFNTSVFDVDIVTDVVYPPMPEVAITPPPICPQRGHKLLQTSFHVDYGDYDNGYTCDWCGKQSSVHLLQGGLYRRWCCRLRTSLP
jgi:hypothetical protein